jgi:mono/diheme cytochrome c family protein
MRTPTSIVLGCMSHGFGSFLLLGWLTSPAQAQELRDEYHRAPRDTVSQAVYDGWKQFNLNCARCHGEDVQGTTIAPHLIVSLRPDGPINTKEIFIQTVCAGRPAKGMPSWCALGMELPTIEKIYAYVKGRSDSKIAAGRPAVKPGA